MSREKEWGNTLRLLFLPFLLCTIVQSSVPHLTSCPNQTYSP